MTQITTWSEERWALRSDNSVALVDKQEFEATPASLRFSYSDSLRAGVEPALAVRDLLSGIRSRDVADAFSHAYGSKIEYKSSDVARYRYGHYLRRHADTFADRVFGVLTFLSPDWSHSHGGGACRRSSRRKCRLHRPRARSFGDAPYSTWISASSLAYTNLRLGEVFCRVSLLKR